MNRETFLYWWPVVARVAGLVGAFGQMGYSAVTHQGADPAFMVFCGSLLVAPNIFDAQGRRNTPGGEEEK